MTITYVEDYIKGGDNENRGIKRNFIPNIEKLSADGADETVLRFIISTGSVDRDYDTIDQSGWMLDNYKANPVVLFAHDHKQPAVGKGENTAVSSIMGKNVLQSEVRFMPRDMYAFSHSLGLMYKGGFMRATSVGFRGVEYKFNDKGVDFLKQELLEYSLVPVPANPEALMMAKSAGIDILPLKSWAESILDREGSQIWLPRKTLEKMVKDAGTDSKIFLFLRDDQGEFQKHAYDLNGDRVELSNDGKTTTVQTPAVEEQTISKNKGAISYNSAHADGTPKAAKDTAWSGPSEISAASVDELKAMCAWVDSPNKENKTAYKLPHHKAAGQHALVWRGVTAAMGALLGARGGVDIPDGDRKSVYNHIARHYRDFDETAPDFKFVESQVLKNFPDSFVFNEETGQVSETVKTQQPSAAPVAPAETLTAEDIVKMTTDAVQQWVKETTGKLD